MGTYTPELRALVEQKLVDRIAQSRGVPTPLLPEAQEDPEHVCDLRCLLDTVAAVLADGKVDASDYEPVALLLEDLYEQYVRAYDIPYVPNLIEPRLDDFLKAQIRPILKALFETLL